MENKETEYEFDQNRVNPKKFALWLLIIAAIMLFAGLTSAYIVRMGEGNWYKFELPVQFLYSTLIIVLSSITMWMSYRAIKREDYAQLKMGLVATLILGLGFCYLQYLGWQALTSMGLFFADEVHGDRVSASFIYALSGLHLVHILGGILFLMILTLRVFFTKDTSKLLLSSNMCNTYWHFVGVLWVYLYLFFYFAH